MGFLSTPDDEVGEGEEGDVPLAITGLDFDSEGLLWATWGSRQGVCVMLL